MIINFNHIYDFYYDIICIWYLLSITIENAFSWYKVKWSNLQTSGFARERQHWWRYRVARLEVDALPSCQLGSDLHGALSRCKKLREIFLFSCHFSIRCPHLTADSCGYSGWRGERDPLLRYPEMVETFGADRLVRRSNAMFLFAFCMFWQHHYILFSQWFQTQHL